VYLVEAPEVYFLREGVALHSGSNVFKACVPMFSLTGVLTILENNIVGAANIFSRCLQMLLENNIVGAANIFSRCLQMLPDVSRCLPDASR
jgi:hypothetical protein